MRNRIVLLVVAMTTLVVLAFAIPLAILIRHNVYDDALKDLQGETNEIANYLHGSLSAPSQRDVAAHLSSLSGDRAASVQFGDGTVVGQLPPGGLAALPPVPGFDGNPRDQDGGGGPGSHGGPPQATPQAYRDGQLVQLPILGRDPNAAGSDPAAGEVVVRVYASDDELHSGETNWWLLLLGTSVGLLVIGVLAAELLSRRLVRPLVRTAETAHRISTGDVTARAPTGGPREIASVGVALNRLGERIDELIADERETVADLSHRLRTPLTALRLDAEALHDPADAERIGTHVSALERMLTAVIHAARRPQREGRMPACDAAAVVGERVSFWSALAEDQGRAGRVSVPATAVPVRAAAEDLAAAVDALLENVIAHTPEGAPFAVTLVAQAEGAVLTVSDDGPGLPADAAVRGRSDRGSTGLGLDIARRCAEASGGSISLGRAASGGALVTLVLGPPA